MSFCLLLLLAVPDDKPADPRAALQPFQELIGRWKATGTQEGQRGPKAHWVEMVEWAWQLKGSAAKLTVTFENGKHFTKGELDYLPEEKRYRLRLHAADGTEREFRGALAER